MQGIELDDVNHIPLAMNEFRGPWTTRNEKNSVTRRPVNGSEHPPQRFWKQSVMPSPWRLLFALTRLRLFNAWALGERQSPFFQDVERWTGLRAEFVVWQVDALNDHA